jgi:hypothetical protein
MSKPAEILLKRIDDRLGDLGKTRYWLSKEVTDGARHGVITDIERKGFLPAEPRLRRMAEALGTTTDFLMGRTDDPAQPASEVSFRDVSPAWRGNPDSRIKVLGSGYCDDLLVDSDGGEAQIERLQLDLDHTIRLIERPPALWNAPDAYAIYYHGSSMEPRFYQGEIGIVDPRRPPGPGDFVVVQLNDGGSDTIVTVLVKQLERIAGGWVHLRQFNPDMRFKLPRSQVARLHRIASPNELFGG